MSNPNVNTFLFAWNPLKYKWPEIDEYCRLLNSGQKVTESWSCASHKKIKTGDRAFVSIVGIEPRGIFASGSIASEPFIGKDHRGNMKTRVLIEFDVLLNPGKENILTIDLLNMGKMEKQVWAPQASGISIKPDITEELEALWLDFLKTENRSGSQKNFTGI